MQRGKKERAGDTFVMIAKGQMYHAGHTVNVDERLKW